MKFKLQFLMILVLSSLTIQSFGAVRVDDLSKMFPKEIIEQQSKSGKSILAYCYTSWCKPCMKMSKEVFADKKVKEYMDRNIIFYRVDMESEEGEVFNKEYNITTYPTFLIFQNGVMKKKFIGAYGADAFLDKLIDKIDASKLSEATTIKKN